MVPFYYSTDNDKELEAHLIVVVLVEIRLLYEDMLSPPVMTGAT